jgi:hypothetical protein
MEISEILGLQLKAKKDRILEFANVPPMHIWERDQVLFIGGVSYDRPGDNDPDVLIMIDEDNWENLPLSALPEYFDVSSRAVHPDSAILV